MPNARARLNEFGDTLYKEIYDNLNDYDKGRLAAVVGIFLHSTLLLFAVGLNGSAIIELHSVLERIAVIQTAKYLAIPSKRTMLSDMIERFTLPDLASMLKDLGVLDKRDLEYTRQLSALRNGIAHKNPKVISNKLLSGQGLSFIDIDEVLSQVDCVPQLIGAVRFFIRLTDPENEKRRWRVIKKKPSED